MCCAGTYVWSDGSAVYYSNWAANEPNSKDEKCTELYADAKWNDNDCNVKRGFICRIQQGINRGTIPLLITHRVPYYTKVGTYVSPTECILLM